ncbi:hypothetical protein BDBG_17709 [Blastomyces gilchristii SLH14081]|uniref:Uncharacterized protein n=1 Tax=Blastomyces gilchristii (strain SLH14081) TaxID=559298 RepID=A0A179UYG8_BLAGS|nr:uncharacterized protein BDBG_17709 [Blastomyces gilchristii SLH14081]OAT12863.1 hypothetical protein BDBG_17709 [Blastomyces gilchristii SLH14081]
MPVNTRSINREETPENQTTAPESFPTPITARKPPHNNNNQDNDNMTDEAAALRRCIAQMDEELCQMRASSNSTATATVNDGNDLSPDLTAYLQNQGNIPALSRVLQEFRERVKYLQKPGLLKSTSDYPIWKEEILLVVKQSHTEDILTSKPLENVKIRRARLFKEFNDISATATYDGFNHLFIECLLAIRVEYIRLEYANIPNFIFFDKLLNGLTKKWSTFIRDRMDYAAKDDNVTSLEDDFLDLCRDILLRLPLDDKNARNDTKNNKDAIKDVKDNKNTKKKCTACKMEGHDEPSCWFEHSEK